MSRGNAAPAAARVAASERAARTAPVWDPAVRLLHASLVLSVALSALGLVAFFDVHRPAGYVAAAVVVARAAWGFAGPRHARWSSFLRGPRATLAYAGETLRGRAPRHLGHNPLGGWMAVALCATVLGLALTGWLYTTDAYWGDETVETVHVALAWMLLALVALHVAGALLTGWLHRENLVAAMIDGKKAPPRPGDVV